MQYGDLDMHHPHIHKHTAKQIHRWSKFRSKACVDVWLVVCVCVFLLSASAWCKIDERASVQRNTLHLPWRNLFLYFHFYDDFWFFYFFFINACTVLTNSLAAFRQFAYCKYVLRTCGQMRRLLANEKKNAQCRLHDMICFMFGDHLT